MTWLGQSCSSDYLGDSYNVSCTLQVGRLSKRNADIWEMRTRKRCWYNLSSVRQVNLLHVSTKAKSGKVAVARISIDTCVAQRRICKGDVIQCAKEKGIRTSVDRPSTTSLRDVVGSSKENTTMDSVNRSDEQRWSRLKRSMHRSWGSECKDWNRTREKPGQRREEEIGNGNSCRKFGGRAQCGW